MDDELRHLERTDRRKWRAMRRRMGDALGPEPGDHCRVTPLKVALKWSEWKGGPVYRQHVQLCGDGAHDEPYEVEMLMKNQAEAWLVRCLEHGTEDMLIIHTGLKVEVL